MSCILFKCSVLINFVLLEITYYPWGLDNFFSGEDTKSFNLIGHVCPGLYPFIKGGKRLNQRAPRR